MASVPALQHVTRRTVTRMCAVALAYMLDGALGTAEQRQSADYIIGPSDILQVTVFGQEKLSGKFTVASDGTFAYPSGDRVRAGGLTVQAVENDIRTRLAKDYLRDPKVSVIVDTVRSQFVTVAGAVRTPRMLEYTRAMSIQEALTMAGGPAESAGTEVLIIRSNNAGSDTGQLETTGLANGATQIRIDLPKLQTGDVSQNIQLQSGDQVLVQVAGKVFVQGKVVRVGEIPYRRGMTVNQAITLAGGPTEFGSTRGIEIQRTVNGELKKMKAKLTDAVNSGDTIVVKPRAF
jgi:polysaccharide biosynthesis/export protein